MGVLILRRFLFAIPTLLIIIALAFFMMRLAPGGPFDKERQLPSEIEANVKAAYDLDKPLPVQFAIYLSRLSRGDFGPSFTYKDFTVGELILRGAPVSARLGFTALAVALMIGTLLGTVAAMRQNSPVDYAVMGTAMVGITVPNYVIGPLLTLVFGIGLRVLPTGGWGGGALDHMILPVTALALPQIAIIARLTRGGMIEVLRSNFVRTARAKGLPEHQVILRHALRGGLLPLVAYLGPAAAALVTGSLIIEQIFQLPGIGRYFVVGAIQRDYTLVMGVVVFYASLIIILNMLADLLLAALDPRVRID
ncbi:MAG: oligopeptide ABC transporter permease OppB [Alphaproteobacteria bacterium]